MKQQQFVQSMRLGDRDFDLGHLIEIAYIEKPDTSGPIMVARFNDYDGLIRDYIGLKKGSVIDVSLEDPFNEDGIFLNESFKVLSMPMTGKSVLTLNCMQVDIERAMQPSIEARLFTGKSGLSIIRKLIKPSAKVKSPPSPVFEDYHLLPSRRPADLVMQIARERGFLFSYNRKEIIFNSVENLLKEDSSLVYHHNDSRQYHQVIDYRMIDKKYQINDLANRGFGGFDLKKGIISPPNKGKPYIHTGVTNRSTLRGLSSVPVPVIDILCGGNGSIRTGAVMDIVWNNNNIEIPIDESLPSKVVVGACTHWYKANRYQCRLNGLI